MPETENIELLLVVHNCQFPLVQLLGEHNISHAQQSSEFFYN